jgi:hypothetical protein
MKHEWDDFFLGARIRVSPRPRRQRVYRTIDYYQPSGWGSPGVKKIVRVYWRTTVMLIKVLLAIPLSLLAIGAFWFLWITLTLFYSAIIHRFVA